MPTIFEHTDNDGDRIRVIRMDWDTPNAEFAVRADKKYGGVTVVHLSRETAARLHAALAPYAEAAPVEIVEGRDYRLLPNAKRFYGESVGLLGNGTTRVEVVRSEPDDDGELFVRAVDGANPGDYDYVMPDGIAPLDGTEHMPAEHSTLDPRRVEALRQASAILAESWESTADATEIAACAEFLLGQTARMEA